MCHAFPMFKVIGCLAVLLLSSCNSTNRMLKARPLKLSAFFEQPAQVIDSRKKLPFHKIWMTPDKELEALVVKKTELYIAPATTQHLRPVKKALMRKEIAVGSIDRREEALAHLLKDEFAKAFTKSPHPRYRIVEQPGPNSLTLELALVELNPTSPKGNVVKTAMEFVVGPLALLGGYFTIGNIAIEGKVRDSETGKLFFQFADNESDKLTFLCLRDFKPYGHSAHAIHQWAGQFELMTRTPVGQTIKDTHFFTLMPY